jgi:hypothetical protein
VIIRTSLKLSIPKRTEVRKMKVEKTGKSVFLFGKERPILRGIPLPSPEEIKKEEEKAEKWWAKHHKRRRNRKI